MKCTHCYGPIVGFVYRADGDAFCSARCADERAAFNVHLPRFSAAAKQAVEAMSPMIAACAAVGVSAPTATQRTNGAWLAAQFCDAMQGGEGKTNLGGEPRTGERRTMIRAPHDWRYDPRGHGHSLAFIFCVCTICGAHRRDTFDAQGDLVATEFRPRKSLSSEADWTPTDPECVCPR